MPEEIFLPYEYAESAFEIAIDSIRLDDKKAELKPLVDLDQGAIALSGVGRWEKARIRLHVTDPNDELAGVVLEGEEPDAAVEVYALLRSPDARHRLGIPLKRKDDSWRGDIGIGRAQYRGTLALEAIGVRAAEGKPDGERAWRRGERVAGSDRWNIYLDDKIAMPGGAIDGEWADFRIDSRAELRSRADCSYYLDLTDPDRPKLFLNEGVEGLKQSLEAGQRIGRAARVRDALTHSLLQPVILAMAVHAIEGSRDVALEEVSGWHRKLLLHLAQRCDGKTEEKTVESWLASWKSDDRAEVFVDLGTAIQRHLDLSKGAKQLVKALEAHGNGEA